MLKLQKKTVANIEARAAIAKQHDLISEAAYLLAERRGFIPGGELQDWLAAESQIEAEA